MSSVYFGAKQAMVIGFWDDLVWATYPPYVWEEGRHSKYSTKESIWQTMQPIEILMCQRRYTAREAFQQRRSQLDYLLNVDEMKTATP